MGSGIYRITNKFNGGIYIGQSMDIEKHLKAPFQHLDNGDYMRNNTRVAVTRQERRSCSCAAVEVLLVLFLTQVILNNVEEYWCFYSKSTFSYDHMSVF